MKTAALFERSLRVATAGLEPGQINATLAKTARAALADAISSGEASERYVRSVNGRIGAPEETVDAPGPIVYRFSYLDEAVVYALAFARERSPTRKGTYKRSWFAMVNGRPWDGQSPIPLDAEVIVTNDQPYHRKIEVGAMTMRVPPHIVEDTRQAVQRAFRGAIRAQMRFVDLAGAYRLERNHGRRGRRKGDPITYPAVILTMV